MALNGYTSLLVELQAINYAFQTGSIRFLTDNYITSDNFSTYKEHYKYIEDYYKQYHQMPSKESFSLAFKDNKEKFEWIDVTDSEQYIVDGLRENLMFKQASNLFNTAGKMFNDGDSTKALQYMISQSRDILNQIPSNAVDLIDDIKLRQDSYIDRVEHHDANYASTGLKELDEVLGGGWDTKNSTVAICGRTGLGKSWLLVKFAAAAAMQGFNVGYYSGEMESDLIGYRLDTFIGNIPNGSLTHGNIDVKDQYNSYVENIKSIVKGHLLCITPDNFGGIPTVDMIASFVEKNNINFLCIDQLSLLDDSKRAKTPREQFMNISKDLRTLQRLKKIPILFAVQLNREQSDDGPSTRNIAESDRIGQDATEVIFIERKEENLVLTLGKSRNSKSGDKLTYKWSVNTGILKFLADEDDATGGKEVDDTLKSYTDFDTNGDKSDLIF